MSCIKHQQQILEHDWSSSSLGKAAELFAHIQQCEECQQTLADHDTLRDLLQPTQEGDPTPADGWEHFEAKLSRPFEVMVRCDASGIRRGPRTGWHITLATSLLVAVVGWSLYFHSFGEKPVRITAAGQQSQQDPSAQGKLAKNILTDDSLRLSAEDIKNGVALFRQVAEVADGRVSWVAEAPGIAELGISAEPFNTKSNLLLLRLVLTRNDQTALSTKLAMVPGQTVAVTIPFEGGKTVRYQIKANGNGAHQVSLAAEVHDMSRPDQAEAMLATHLTPVDGQVIRAGTLQTSEGGYALAMAFVDHKPASFGL